MIIHLNFDRSGQVHKYDTQDILMLFLIFKEMTQRTNSYNNQINIVIKNEREREKEKNKENEIDENNTIF